MNAQLDTEFRDFMHARWATMVRLAYALTGDQGHAEDVAQAALGTSALPWTTGVPGVALGIAAQPVTRVVVTSPDGKTTPVRPVTVGGVRLFAFPLGRGPKPWKWTAYDSSGHVITSGKVTPQSQ